MNIIKHWRLSMLILGATIVIPTIFFIRPLSAVNPAGDGIRLCSIGYTPQASKRATVAGVQDLVKTFRILDAQTHKEVFNGTLGAAGESPNANEVVRLADFSGFTASGEYVMEIDGLPESTAFQIAPDSLNRSLEAVMIGFYGHRCGQAVKLEWKGQTFEHPACHTEDGGLDYYDPAMAGQKKDGTGGWHDAGDYGKYSVNAAFSCAIMLSAWEQNKDSLTKLKLPIPESGGAIPDYLAEVKFNLDWLLKMQFPDGRVSHKLTAKRFCPMGTMPEKDTQKRYFAPWSKLATVDFAAVACIAARVFDEYDLEYATQWRTAARKAWEAARNAPDVPPDLSAFHTGAYNHSAENDTKWALIELYIAFGDGLLNAQEVERFHNCVDENNQMFFADWDWGNGYNIGLYSWLNSEKAKENPEALARLKKDLLACADKLVKNHDSHAYGRSIRRNYWGANGSVARAAMNLNEAYKISGDAKYINAAFDQIAYLYGRNPFNRSFVTGDGINPPLFPHHRPSAGDGIEAPWPGHLTGGANPTELDWVDETGNYRTNEFAINWDASLVYALSVFYNAGAKK